MSEAANTFVVHGEFSIYRAAELTQTLQDWWPQATAAGIVQLDLAKVSEIDSAGIQLVLAAQRSAQEQHLEFQITAASEAVAHALRLCALQQWLPSAAP